MADNPEAAQRALDDLAAAVDALNQISRSTLARGAWIPPWIRGRSPGTESIWDALRALLDRETGINALYEVLLQVGPDNCTEMMRTTIAAIETDPDRADFWHALQALISASTSATTVPDASA